MYEQFKTASLTLDSWILTNMLKPEPFISGVCGMLITICLLSGNRLSLLNMPEHPLLSPIFRLFGHLSATVAKVVIGILLIVAAILFLISFYYEAIEANLHSLRVQTVFFLLGASFGGAVSIPIIYRWLPLLERGQGIDDVEKLAAKLKKMCKPFNPEDYIKLKRGILLGLDDHRRPVYISKETLQKNHTQLSLIVKGVVAFAMIVKPLLSTPESLDCCFFWCD